MSTFIENKWRTARLPESKLRLDPATDAVARRAELHHRRDAMLDPERDGDELYLARSQSEANWAAVLGDPPHGRRELIARLS